MNLIASACVALPGLKKTWKQHMETKRIGFSR
jgi:hypothetical protein